MAKLSAFADEVTDDFLEQVKYLASEQKVAQKALQELPKIFRI